MRSADHNSRGKKICLTDNELTTFIDSVSHGHKRWAVSVMARSGLTPAEVVRIAAEDLVDTERGLVIRVPDEKSETYRESPIPSDLFHYGRGLGHDRNTIVNASKRTVQRCVSQTGKQLSDETDNEDWSEITCNDLRRSWVSALIDSGVEPVLVMSWGGWSDYESFADMYLTHSVYDTDFQSNQREKIDWL